MDGLQLAKYAKENRPDVIIIIFSAYSEFDYAKKACEVSAVNYLLKPIEVEEFKQVMEHVIALCRQKKQWKEQKENLLVADKKLLLYRLFNTKESVTEIVEKLKEYKINLENKYICFVSIETRNNYFELCEEEFEKILKRNMKLPYEQIDFYPNQIYVIIYSREPDRGTESGKFHPFIICRSDRGKSRDAIDYCRNNILWNKRIFRQGKRNGRCPK